MKTYLLNLMQSFFASPQGPARLYGYARRAGMDVTFLNFNHDAYSWLLSEPILREMLEEARPAMLAALGRDRYLRRAFGAILMESSGGEIRRLLASVLAGESAGSAWWGRLPLAGGLARRIAHSRLDLDRIGLALFGCADELAGRVGQAQREMDRLYMRQPAGEFLARFRTLLCGKAIIDALHWPAQLDFGLGFWGTAYGARAAELVRSTSDRRHNFLIPFLASQVMPRLRRDQPGLVGLSATHGSELTGVFTLAAMIRREMPDTHVTLGGAAVSDIRDRIARNPCLWECIDSLVYGPGEVAWGELADAVESSRPLDRVPNLIYRQGRGGPVMYSSGNAELHPDQATTPEYVGLRPGGGVALETSTSCYWGRCAFCYYPRQGSPSRTHQAAPCRQRSMDLVLEDLHILRHRHDPCYVGLTDSAVPPDRLAELARLNVQTGLNLPFSAFIRLEDRFTDQAFCRQLAEGGFLGGQAGLESACPEVNARINKGIDLACAPAILRNFRQAGLLLHLYTLVGFPGETVDQAWSTYRFLRRHHRQLALDWQVYSLWVLENGPLAENPEAAGLCDVRPLADDVLLPLCTYQVRRGLSQAQSVQYSLLFEDKLRRFRCPLSRLMDVEAYKIFLFSRQGRQWRGEHDPTEFDFQVDPGPPPASRARPPVPRESGTPAAPRGPVRTLKASFQTWHGRPAHVR